MNFAGMVFEILLCGVWWMIALGLLGWGVASLTGHLPTFSVSDMENLGNILKGLSGVIGVVFLTVAYALGQAGRRIARDLFRDTRKRITAAALERHWVSHTALIDDGFGAQGLNIEMPPMSWLLAYVQPDDGNSKAVRRQADAEVGFNLYGTRPRTGTNAPNLPPALNDIRYASDIMRDVVLAADNNDLRHDLDYHWRCLDAAQNACIPFALAVVGVVALISAGNPSLIWPLGDSWAEGAPLWQVLLPLPTLAVLMSVVGAFVLHRVAGGMGWGVWLAVPLVATASSILYAPQWHQNVVAVVAAWCVVLLTAPLGAWLLAPRGSRSSEDRGGVPRAECPLQYGVWAALAVLIVLPVLMVIGVGDASANLVALAILAATAGCYVVWLLYRSTCYHAMYHEYAIFRGFIIAMQRERQRRAGT